MIYNQKSRYSLNILIDLVLLNSAFVGAATYSQSWLTLQRRPYMFFLLFALNVLWYFTTKLTVFYESFIIENRSRQLANIIKNSAAQTIVAVLFIFIAKEDLFTRYFILFYFLGLSLLISLRVILIDYFTRRVSGNKKFLRNLVIAGTGKIGSDFLSIVDQNQGLGYKFIGFVGKPDESKSLNPFLGPVENLDSILKEYAVEELVIALPYSEYRHLKEIVSVCERNAVRIHIIPDYLQFLSKNFLLNRIGGLPVITLRGEPLAEIQWRIAKRVFDLALTFFFGLFFLSWLTLLISLLIKFTSRGPVFFIQDRIGLKNEKFRCFKFRSMFYFKPDTETIYDPVTENDLRVTFIGKFLRKTNLDEIPQFWNILKGEMSIVGPRPHALSFNQEYIRYFDAIKLRHLVKPGLTGWAQIHGLRGDHRDQEENKKRTIKRIEYDIWYIENWSMGLDIKIIFRTILQMLTGKTSGY
jgi:putative colanic acid biosysnthesis UDP-glucose lipid carrier transferase